VTLALLGWAAAGPALSGGLVEIDEALHTSGLNASDRERQERGYYEQLLDAGRRIDGDAGDEGSQPVTPTEDEGPAAASQLTLAVADARETVLRPSFTINHLGATWTTNAAGLRDREYARPEPPGTFRIALLGDSIAAGWGVADGQGFEPKLEAMLDAASRQAGGPRVEILNFAVPGHAPGQRFEHFVRSGGFDPALGIDAILFEATPADAGWDLHRLRRTAWLGTAFESPVYGDMLRSLGVRPGRDVEYYKRRLKPYRWSILESVYATAEAEASKRGIPIVWFLIPRVGKANDAQDRRDLIARARSAGFDPVVDLSHLFDGVDPAALAVSPNDYHPNADGHARIAEGLFQALRSPAGRPGWWPVPAAAASESLSQQGFGEGVSPILLRGLRKIGTDPGPAGTDSKLEGPRP
jgi:hypothetical protein